MNNVKRVNGNYIVDLVNPGDKVYINGDIDISGSATITGEFTYVDTENTRILDQFMELNISSNVAIYNGSTLSGILVRTDASIDHLNETGFAGIRYNDTNDTWQVSSATSNGTNGSWSTLTTGGSVAGNIYEVQLNDGAGSLTASSLLTYNTSTQTLSVASTTDLDGVLVMQDQFSSPTPQTGATNIYAQPPGAGESGIYVSNDNTTDELITRRKAIVYGLIF